MKHFFLLPLFLVSSVLCAQPNTYKYRRPVSNVSAAGYYEIPVSPEIAAKSESQLADLRLYAFGSDTTEVPFFLRRDGDQAVETAVPFLIINDSYNQKCCSYVTLKLDAPKVLNRIKLDVAESDFDKLIVIEGSNDNKNWFTIAEKKRILRFSGGGYPGYSYTILDFKDSEYSYFRLKLDDDSSPRVTITGASAYQVATKPGSYNLIGCNGSAQEEDKKAKTSSLVLKLDVPAAISYIKVETAAEGDFYRSFNIYRAGDSIRSPKGNTAHWIQIGSGTLSSREQNIIWLNSEKSSVLKIEVNNYDDQPVRISKVEVYSEKVTMVAKTSSPNGLFLYYGKSDDRSPVYDLVHFREQVPEKLAVAGTEAEERINVPAAEEKSEPLFSNKMWLWLGMLVVILVIGYFSLSMLRKENNP